MVTPPARQSPTVCAAGRSAVGLNDLVGDDMKRIAGALALAIAMANATPALAAQVYRFSGTFAPATTATSTTLLGGGSFDGTFAFASNNFPTADGTNFQSFSLNLRNAAGTILFTLTSGVGTAGGYIGTSYAATYGGTRIYFYDATQDYLQLVVPTGFGGTGAVLANGSSYAQIAPRNQARVNAGIIVALPEPATWAMMVIGFGALGATLRRGKVRATVA